MDCKNCKKPLTDDEIGIYRRMVFRAAEECLCMECFSKEFNISVKAIKKKIEHFKKMGCTLFK